MKTRLVAGVAILAVCFSAGAAWSQEKGSAAPVATEPAAPQFEQDLRLHLLTDNIAFGRAPDADQLEQLVEGRGIQRVVCLRNSSPAPDKLRTMIGAQGLTYEEVPIGLDLDKPQAKQRIDRDAVKQLVEHLADTDVTTYICDQDGLIGAPFVGFAYRTLVSRWQFASALKEAIQSGFRADQYPGVYLDVKLLACGLDELPELQPTEIPDENLLAPGEKIEVAGIPLNVKRAGKGPPVYALHGGPGETHMQFRPYLDPLVQRFDLVYYDQRGCGLSGRPQFEEAYTLDRMVDELDGLRQKLGHDKISLIGHASGGVLALRYALKYPQHVNKLVLVSTWASGEDFMQCFHLIEATMSGTRREEFLNMFTDVVGKQHRNFNDAELNKLVKIMAPYAFFQRPTEAFLEDWNRRANVSALVNDAMQNEIFKTLDLRERLPELSGIPTLVVAGKFDTVVSPSAQLTIAHAIQGAKPVLFQMSGHYPYVEEPRQFISIVARFLMQGEPAATQPAGEQKEPAQDTP